MSAMNLGDSNLRYVNSELDDPTYYLAYLYEQILIACPKKASRPQLVHTSSKQSVAASDDYYSLTSEASSNDDQTTAPRYETPPMHMHPTIQDAQQSEATIPTTNSIRTKEMNGNSRPATAALEHQAIKRKPVSSSSSSSEGTIVRRPISAVSPPTPGVDDTPYIQFAIEQLTRDEEVAGPRHQSNGAESPYPVERIVSNQFYNTKTLQPPPIPPLEDPQSPREFLSLIL